MQNNEKITELKKNLPLGGRLEVSKRVNLNPRTVDNILKGKSARMTNIIKVIKATQDVINEFTEITQKA